MRRSFTSHAARSLRTALADCPYGALDDCLVVIPLGSSSMDQYRDLAMREYLDRLAAEDEGGDAVAAMRGHDDKVTALRDRRIDDRLVGMFVLDMDRLA